MNATQALLACSLAALSGCKESRADTVPPVDPPSAPAKLVAAPPAPAPPAAKTIRVSAVGDCTLATEFGLREGPTTFPYELADHGGDPKHFFSGVVSVLSGDDLTIANLETTLTNVPSPASPGRPRFRGRPEYTAILKEGSVELVNVANNHSHDFGLAGYAETVKSVRDAGIGVSGNEHVDRRTIQGVEIVNLGFTGGDPVILSQVVRRVKQAKTEKNLVFVSFHWGAEGSNQPNGVQLSLGHAAVDAGADLVIGTHPHVLQGIEEYKGKHIVYSLGNFVFGGHGNPSDKDSIIYQETFTEQDGTMVPAGMTILPVRISGVTNRNDFRPVLLDGDDRQRVLTKVRAFSEALPRWK